MSYWYLATPYSAFPDGLEAAHAAACRLAAGLIEKGWPIFCPIAHSHVIARHMKADPRSHDFWVVQVDMPMMRGARRGMLIGKMSGWDQSIGIRLEREWFEAAGRQVLEIDPDNLPGAQP